MTRMVTGNSAGFGDQNGLIALDHTRKLIVVSFKGSSNLENWLTDVDFPRRSVPLCDGCEAHVGFDKGWDSLSSGIVNAIKDGLNGKAQGYRIVTTGHSLGGALAQLAAAYMRNDQGWAVDSVCSSSFHSYSTLCTRLLAMIVHVWLSSCRKQAASRVHDGAGSAR